MLKCVEIEPVWPRQDRLKYLQRSTSFSKSNSFRLQKCVSRGEQELAVRSVRVSRSRREVCVSFSSYLLALFSSGGSSRRKTAPRRRTKPTGSSQQEFPLEEPIHRRRGKRKSKGSSCLESVVRCFFVSICGDSFGSLWHGITYRKTCGTCEARF